MADSLKITGLGHSYDEYVFKNVSVRDRELPLSPTPPKFGTKCLCLEEKKTYVCDGTQWIEF